MHSHGVSYAERNFGPIGDFGPYLVSFICTLIALLLIADPVVAANPVSTPEAPAEFILQSPPRPITPMHFKDAQGVDHDLSMFAGRIVLLNLWASWCAPCRAELPALDHLQAALGGPGFEVAALSVDRGGIDAVRKFVSDNGITRLAIYNDASGRAYTSSGALGLPVTLLIDRHGNEIARVLGPADWESPPIRTFLRALIQEGRVKHS
jgi:thiol-disulfide isomerase/thioredoxin